MKHHAMRIVFLAALVLCGRASAYTITLDADPSDWLSAPPFNINTGHVARTSSLEGEFVWLDNPADERTDFSAPDTSVDIRQVRITSDPANLYIGLVMQDIQLASGNGTVQVQVAIDRDGVSGSGESWLGSLSDTQVSAQAEWEFLVITRFASGNPPLVYNPSWTDVSGGLAQAAISTTTEGIEILVPWAVIGGAPTAPLSFTIATMRSSDTDDQAWDLGGPAESDVLDAVTNYGDPGTLANTWNEVSDAIVNYHFQLWFHLDADLEPSPPLLINEVMYDPDGADPGEEFIEVFNRTGINDFPTADYKVGDEETVNAGEGMRAFPPGATIRVDDVLVVANNNVQFALGYAMDADYEINTSDVTPDMVPYPLWATGTITLSNTGDEVLLLDPHDTIIDAVAYEGGTYPGVVAHGGAPEGDSIERPQFDEDSDNCTRDFVVQTSPTPGELFWKKALGVTCTFDIECLGGICADGYCCDSRCDGTCDDACDASGHCQPLACPAPTNDCQLSTCSPTTGCVAASGTACTDSAPGDCNDALCDDAGNCDQAAALESSSYTCRASAGLCDVAESCTGTDAACPTDAFQPSSHECRASAGLCDVAETCTGTSVDCPTNAYQPATHECRASAGACDAAETCTGTSIDCPADSLEPATTVCRASTDLCDAVETCDGSSVDCPDDELEPATSVCRASAGACDAAELCTGTDAACPTDLFEPAVLECRASAGACDVAEYCTGTGPACPTDALRTTSYECRASTDLCDAAEFCTGTSSDCPADVLEPNSTVCRDEAGPCDVEEYCTGTTAACPADVFVDDGTTCTDGDPCTESDVCASGTCGGTAKDCSSAGDQCNAGVCNAATGECEAAPVANGTACDDGDDCTDGEACQDGVCTGGTDICVEEGAEEPVPDADADDVVDAVDDVPADRPADGVEDAVETVEDVVTDDAVEEDAGTDIDTGGGDEGCSCTIVG